MGAGEDRASSSNAPPRRFTFARPPPRQAVPPETQETVGEETPPPSQLVQERSETKPTEEEREYVSDEHENVDDEEQEDLPYEEEIPQEEQEEEEPLVYYQNIYDHEWTRDYELCPVFGPVWNKLTANDGEWETGYQLWRNMLYFEGKLCIPSCLQEPYIREMHAHAGHIGYEKFWPYVNRQISWARRATAESYAKK